LTPDTEFFLDYGEFKDGLDVLECALYTGEGFTKVTGEVGTGKTLLCRKLLHTLDESFMALSITNPAITPKALLSALAKTIDISNSYKTSQSRLLELICSRLIVLQDKGRRLVLAIDEAQSLSDETMGALRLFSNLETEKSKLLQLVLFGQPELDSRLQQDHFRQLRQRIAFSHTLKPLELSVLTVYVQHRMNVAGCHENVVFSSDAMPTLLEGSGGVPRVINVLAHKALLVAFGRGDSTVVDFHINKAIEDSVGLKFQHQRTSQIAALCGFRGRTVMSL
jgi:MSHA biogenesis protein MshM